MYNKYDVNLVLFKYDVFCITVSYDVCYHLLKLFTDPMHQLETLLNPATITADPLDISVRSEAMEFVSFSLLRCFKPLILWLL